MDPGDALSRDAAVTARLDTYFDVLADRRRRYLLYYLSAIPGETAERSELVRAVRAYETATADADRLPEPEAVAVDLHHHQLPRLEEAALVDYDRRQGTVSYTGDSPVAEWLDFARERELDDAT